MYIVYVLENTAMLKSFHRVLALPGAAMFSDDDHSDDDRLLAPSHSKETKINTSTPPHPPTKRCGVTRCPIDVVVGGWLDGEVKRWPKEKADWVGHLEAAISLRRSRLGQQLRALNIAGGFV